jgi:hypothetical protein
MEAATMNNPNLLQQHLEIKRGGQPALQTWLEAGQDVDQEDAFGFTLLHYAAEHGNVDVVRWLLSQGANVNAQTAYGYTPLHYAARHAEAKLGHVLLAAGADPNAQLTKGRLRWWKPLYFAYSYESADVVALLKPDTEMSQSRTIEPRQHAIRGPYKVVQAYDSWPHPAEIQPTRRRCPECRERAIYNVGYTADGGGLHADRIELFQCGNCSAKFFEQMPLRGNMRPWKALIKSYADHRSDPHPTNFGH